MKNTSNFENVYRALLEGQELTTKLLNSYGFSAYDLRNLVKEGVFVHLKRDVYTLSKVDGLYEQGKKLLGEGKIDEAGRYFIRSFALDSTHLDNCFQLLLYSLYRNNYSKAFALFEIILASDNAFYKNDANYYLYLLYLGGKKIPEQYDTLVRKIRKEEVLVSKSDKRYANPNLQNQIRSTAFEFDVARTFSLFNRNQSNYSDEFEYAVVGKLMYGWRNYEKVGSSLIFEGKYEDALQFLRNKQKLKKLSKNDQMLLYLLNQILMIKSSGNIPPVRKEKCNNAYEAIENDNYSLALQLQLKYIRENNLNEKGSTIYSLLEQICHLIDKTPSSSTTCEDIDFFDSSCLPFSHFLSLLETNDFERAFSFLKDYLQLLNKSDFEFLIARLVKISLLEKDSMFFKPAIAFVAIHQDDFNVDMGKYIQAFYGALAEKEFEIARIYLEILSKANEMEQECILLQGLYQVLSSSEKDFLDERKASYFLIKKD